MVVTLTLYRPKMGKLGRQISTLWRKNARITILRYPLSTFVRASLLPIIFIGFISYSRNLLVPPAQYGIGTPGHIKDLQETVRAHPEQRLVFVNNVTGGGLEAQQVIDSIANPIRQAGGNVVYLTDYGEQLKRECKQTFTGYSPCFAAVVFYDSPKNSTTGFWNYTLRGASSYSNGRINVKHRDNDVQEYANLHYRYLLEAHFFCLTTGTSCHCNSLLIKLSPIVPSPGAGISPSMNSCTPQRARRSSMTLFAESSIHSTSIWLYSS